VHLISSAKEPQLYGSFPAPPCVLFLAEGACVGLGDSVATYVVHQAVVQETVQVTYMCIQHQVSLAENDGRESSAFLGIYMDCMSACVMCRAKRG